MKDQLFRINNLNLIRLMASIQVVVSHTLGSLNINSENIFMNLLSCFPGVPVFFFISGFLISKSFEKNSKFSEYIQNRALRLFPGLIICTILSIIAVYFTGYFQTVELNFFKFVLWFFSQITFFQFYNPDFMRGFGTGVLNGSLWTISVEIQFYLLVPIFYFFLKKIKKTRGNIFLFTLGTLFLLFFYFKFSWGLAYSDSFLFKLFSVSFLPWFWMFIVGIFYQKNFKYLHNLLIGKFIYLFMFYLICCFSFSSFLGVILGNGLNPFLFLVLTTVIFSGAYTCPYLSDKVLKNNDISYGAYIYHIPIVNVFLYYGLKEKYIYAFWVVVLTITLSIFSWLYVEKAGLRLKKHPFNPLSKN